MESEKFKIHCKDVEKKTSMAEMERRFEEYLCRMTSGKEKVAIGEGQWLHFIRGKKMLAGVVNSNCFRVESTNGFILSGEEKTKKIVVDLLQRDEKYQPKDFILLKKLIEKKIRETS